MIDPFSDEADPKRLDGSDPPALDDTVRPLHELSVSRRAAMLTLTVVPAALSVSSCVSTRLACPAQPDEPHRCTHRFCRHYRG